MAYTINGKTFSEHALMDEMVYNLDIIMGSIEIKNDTLAELYETEESLNSSDTYLLIMGGNATFENFPFTKELLMAYGYNEVFASDCAIDRYLIPEEDRENVFSFVTEKFLEDYVEINNYYRALLGLPWYDADEGVLPETFVYLDESYISEEPSLASAFDFDLPLHEYSNYQIAILTALGVLDTVREEYVGKEFKYLRFLGDSKLDLYDVRIASKWDILYMPSVETLVSDRFKELYKINKEQYLHRFYSEAYKLSSDYYDEFMIILLLCETYADMIADIPEWYIRRDIFDLRSCQYFLEANGVEYFKVIPLKYQIKIVKNLNKLIRYKSTNRNMWDIVNIFAAGDVTIYKYYLFKKRIANEQGSYATGKDPADEYELEFIKTPIGESYDDYIKDNIYREPYDDITYQDKWWDGEDTHENVKNNHLARDFTIEGTKFISIEDRISMDDYAYQVQYFLGLVLDSSMEIGDITINIPSISSIVSFPLSDLFIFLYCLTASYDEYNLLIRVPDNKQYGTKPDFTKYEEFDGGGVDTESDFEVFGGDPSTLNKFRRHMNGGNDPEYTELTQESFYDYLAWKYPELWTDLSNRVYGFNMDADLEELQEILDFRHSAFYFEEGYTLEELGVDGFLTTKNIDSIDELVKVYKTNSEIYDNLSEMILSAETRDEKVVYQFVFNYLFTRNFDYDKYTLASTGELANTYDEILKEKNYILYKYYATIISETDKDTKQDQIRAVMNDIINTLEYYLNYDGLDYIFSVFTVTSFANILNYIYLMINFFRSFKVYFLDSYVTYVMDNKLENTVAMNDNIGEVKLSYWKTDRLPIRDNGQVHVELYLTDKLEDNNVEVMDLFGHYEPDPTMDLDIKGNFIGEGWNFVDLDGGPAEEQTYVLNVDGKYALNKSPSYTPEGYYYNIVGGDVSTEIDLDDHTSDPGTILDDGPIRDVDGGGVPLISYSPFYMLNGGIVGIGLNLWDLNGAGVNEQQFYVDINGKIAGNDTLNLIRPINGLNYNVNGGHPDYNMFTTSSMIVRVTDKQISADVKLLPTYHGKANDLTIEDDGLYLEDKWTNIADAMNLSESMSDLIDTYSSLYNDALDTIIISNIPTMTNSRIISIMGDILDEAVYNYKLISGDLLNMNTGYTDSKATELEELFYQWTDGLTLFGWGNFDE